MNEFREYPVAVIGSGDVATELTRRLSFCAGPLQLVAVATDVDGLLHTSDRGEIGLVFDATSSAARRGNRARLEPSGVRIIDVAPSSDQPHCVPAVNLDERLGAPFLGMAPHDAQATVPIVAAVAQCGTVAYAETVSTMSTRSADRDTRDRIDDLIETTTAVMESVGGAQRAKSLVVLNPADPPVLMRNTVYCLVDGDADYAAMEHSIAAMVDRVRAYAPGYRLKQRVQFESFRADSPLLIPETGTFNGTRVTVLLEMQASSDHLPAYAGNVDIVTSAAVATAHRIVEHAQHAAGAHR